MAAKTTKSKKTSSAKKKKTTASTQAQEGLYSEIVILISLAVCVLLILSNFGIGGIVGGGSLIRSLWNFRISGLYYADSVILWNLVSDFEHGKWTCLSEICSSGSVYLYALYIPGTDHQFLFCFVYSWRLLQICQRAPKRRRSGRRTLCTYSLSAFRCGRYVCVSNRAVIDQYDSDYGTFFVQGVEKGRCESRRMLQENEEKPPRSENRSFRKKLGKPNRMQKRKRAERIRKFPAYLLQPL